MPTMATMLLLLASATVSKAQWEPEELPVFMPTTQHELEHYNPVADAASVVLSPMAGALSLSLSLSLPPLPPPSLARASVAPAQSAGAVAAVGPVSHLLAVPSGQRRASQCSRTASSAWNTATRASSR